MLILLLLWLHTSRLAPVGFQKLFFIIFVFFRIYMGAGNVTDPPPDRLTDDRSAARYSSVYNSVVGPGRVKKKHDCAGEKIRERDRE